MVIKHLYKRTITRKGKKIKAWYFWYYDENGKQIRKSCGTNGKPCLTKAEALFYINNINDNDLIPDSVTFTPTLREFAADLYKPGSKFLIKKANRSESITEQTRKHNETVLNIFLDKFGDFKPDEIDPMDIDDWLLELEYSNSYKNNIITRIQEVYKELYAKHIIKSVPLFEKYKKSHKPKGILYPDEIKRLFPSDYEQLIKTWRGYRLESEIDTFQFVCMIYMIISTGMRSCEVRALQWNQFYKDNVIILDAMMDGRNERVNALKKHTDDNKKWRASILSNRLVKMLNTLKAMKDNIDINDYVFCRYNKPITTWYLLEHLRSVLNANGIDTEKRNITVHSLRFTYNTMMRRQISESDLRLLMGHTSEAMTDYYDRSSVIDNIPRLLQNKDIIDNIWN